MIIRFPAISLFDVPEFTFDFLKIRLPNHQTILDSGGVEYSAIILNQAPIFKAGKESPLEIDVNYNNMRPRRGRRSIDDPCFQ